MNEQLLTTLTWLIPAMPIAAFFIIALFAWRNRTLSWMLAWAAIISSLVMSWIVGLSVLGQGVHALEEHPVQISSMVNWLPLGDFYQGQWLRLGVAVDPLGAIMLLMVSFATTMIFVYSVGYHNWGHGLSPHSSSPGYGRPSQMILSLRVAGPRPKGASF